MYTSGWMLVISGLDAYKEIPIWNFSVEINASPAPTFFCLCIFVPMRIISYLNLQLKVW